MKVPIARDHHTAHVWRKCRYQGNLVICGLNRPLWTAFGRIARPRRDPHGRHLMLTAGIEGILMLGMAISISGIGNLDPWNHDAAPTCGRSVAPEKPPSFGVTRIVCATYCE